MPYTLSKKKLRSSWKIRPTMLKVKASIFSILKHRIDWPNAYIADMFAGTGSLGIEALIHGAKHVHFFDNAPHSLRCLTDNVKNWSNSTVIRIDLRFLPKSAKHKFHCILIDPPYMLSKAICHSILCRIVESQYIHKEGIIVLLSNDGNLYHHKDLTYISRKKYGGTYVYIAQRLSTK